MKHKVGDKVRYDGGDWWFYGTVSAVFEHSICPFYRLSVERMEKKNCKFSITQFEFELEPYNEDVDRGKDNRKWENAEIEYLKKYYGVLNKEDLSKLLKRSPQALDEKWQMIKQEPEAEPEKKGKQKGELKQETEEVELAQVQKEEPQMRKISNAWERNLESYRKGEKNSVIQTWASYNRKQYKIGKLEKNKLEKLMEINFSFDSGRKKKSKGKTDELSQEGKKPRKKRGETWNENFELYCKGEKSDLISTWMAYNRKQYKEGKLSEEKFKKLIKVNFPFDVVKNEKADGWDKQLEEWKKGDRKSIPMQQWRQRSIRHFLEGKLSGDRIVKLKEVGILK